MRHTFENATSTKLSTNVCFILNANKVFKFNDATTVMKNKLQWNSKRVRRNYIRRAPSNGPYFVCLCHIYDFFFGWRSVCIVTMMPFTRQCSKDGLVDVAPNDKFSAKTNKNHEANATLDCESTKIITMWKITVRIKPFYGYNFNTSLVFCIVEKNLIVAVFASLCLIDKRVCTHTQTLGRVISYTFSHCDSNERILCSVFLSFSLPFLSKFR